MTIKGTSADGDEGNPDRDDVRAPAASTVRAAGLKFSLRGAHPRKPDRRERLRSPSRAGRGLSVRTGIKKPKAVTKPRAAAVKKQPVGAGCAS